MLNSINPLPIFSYVSNPSVENAQLAMQFLQDRHELFTTLAKVAKNSFLILAACSLVTFLLNSRVDILEDERAQSQKLNDEERSPISSIQLFSKLSLCMTFLSGFAYLSCKGESWLSAYAITWIDFYNSQ